MPSELRHILFLPGEILQAIKDYHRRAGKRLPAGSVVQSRPECDEQGNLVRLRLVLAPDLPEGGQGAAGRETWQDVTVEGPVLAAALILHCRDQRIPLPARGEKAVRIVQGQVCLTTSFGHRRAERARGPG